jgi:hypothetical protein
MGVSFKVSKTGTRFRPKPLPLQPSQDDQSQVILTFSILALAIFFKRLRFSNYFYDAVSVSVSVSHLFCLLG